MSRKTGFINLRRINGEVVIADKTMPSEALRNWYEKTEGREADEIQTVSLTDRRDPNDRKSPIFAVIVENTEFERDDLPMFL